MIDNLETRSRIVRALANATDTAVRQHMRRKSEEETITSRIAGQLENLIASRDLFGFDLQVVAHEVPKNTVEPLLGSDLYIGLSAKQGSKTTRKGIFVQAKREQNRDRQSLRKQCKTMQVVTKKGSAVWIYGYRGLSTSTTTEYLGSGVVKGSAEQFFDRAFQCTLGDKTKAPSSIFEDKEAIGDWIRTVRTREALLLSVQTK